MLQHFHIEHPEFTSLNDPRLSRQFRRAIRITREEQLRLKIPDESIVDSEPFDDSPHDTEEGLASSPRKRAASTNAARRGKKKVP